ncbi:hypothetical protein [Halorubrum sp. SP9]|uniref:hypothetical protein n=1 Tax=Halorubrum sp. SP9 TaxID=1537267 RepID=UPI00130541F7|nr:hypothetical protein [Halorubrum sp. SP9]
MEGSLAPQQNEIHDEMRTVDRGDDDAKPDMRSCAERARSNDTIVVVDTRS